MQLHEKIQLVAGVMTFLAILNWIAGSQSISGAQLLPRTNGPWVAMRWFGLGLVVSGVVLNRQGDLKFSWLMAIGAGIMIVGTARRKLRARESKQKVDPAQ